MRNRKQYPLGFVLMMLAITSLVFLTSSALCAEGTIDVVPDETVNGSVELTPGYISGTIDLGGQNINRIDLTAYSGDYIARIYPPAEGQYTMTVNVPDGGSLEYRVSGMVYLDNYNTRLYLNDRLTTVEAGKTSQVDIIVNSGYIVGKVSGSGCSIAKGEIWVYQYSNNRYKINVFTRFGTDGTFRFPIQPNTNIRIYGLVYMTNGATSRLEDKYIGVSPGQETAVDWGLTCGPGELGAIDHNLNYHLDMDYHYSYLYNQGGGTAYKTVRHDGNYLFDNIAPGDWRLYTYSYWNNRQNYIGRYQSYISVPAGKTVNVDVDTYPGFLQGKITLKGTKTIQDAQYAYIQGYSRSSVDPYLNFVSRSRIESSDGSYNLALPSGEWEIYYSSYYFQNLDPAKPYLRSYLYMYDYSQRNTPISINQNETIANHDLIYETGSATIKYSRSDGGAFSSPYVYARSYNYDENNRLSSYIYSGSYGAGNGDTVTFVGFPGTYDVEAWAYIGQSRTTFGKVIVVIVPGVDKVIDIGGPDLEVETPEPGYITSSSTITVSGKATDETGVESVIVNGKEAVLTSTDNLDDDNEVSFSVEIELSKGANVIKTIASDASENESSDTRSVYFKIQHIEVLVDIKPLSCLNPFNIKSKGVLPVAILGTQDFDVSDINPDSIKLNRVALLRSAVEDVAAPFEPFIGKEESNKCQDDGPDGFDDLTLKFDTPDIVAVLGEVEDGNVVILTLTGELQDGTAIKGEDTVKILNKGKDNEGEDSVENSKKGKNNKGKK